MGVPGCVAWIYKNHKKSNFIFKKIFKHDIDDVNMTNISSNSNILEEQYFNDDVRVDSIQHLLIDTNCLIHPQAKIVCQENPHLVDSNTELLEKKIIKQVIMYIELLMAETKPTDSTYIAIDGVAPMAKIKHQRLRRFKSIYDRKIKEKIAKKYNKVLPSEWNTSAITPGTMFMDKLMKAILQWIKITKFNCKIIFSSCYTPGEGEHKLLQYLKSLNITPTTNTVIYGLDADLLFLSISSKKNNIYLMRETSQMEIEGSKFEEGFSFLSIEVLKKVIKNEMLQRLTSDRVWDTDSVINDFVFLCYFCGNDFLPNIPSLTIKPHNNKIINGIDTIIDAYTTELLNINELSFFNGKICNEIRTKYLIEFNDSKINLNKQLLINIFTNISDQEIAYFNDFYKYRRYIRKSQKEDPFEIELQNYDENIIPKYSDPIELGNLDTNIWEWKKAYYKYYFDIDVNPSNPNDNSLNDILEQYIQGLVWTTYYYYDKCKDYEWFYPYHHGPFMSDLKNYLIKHIERIDFYENLYSINSVWFEHNIKPLQQLMLVLPHESSFLIPSTYRNLLYSVKLNKYFPPEILNIKVDHLYKNKAWQNILMVDIIPAKNILKLTSKIILKDEAERNKHYKEYIKECG
jgi:5'-3' exoribonuclease 2